MSQEGCIHHGLDSSPPHAPVSLHVWGHSSETHSSPTVYVSLSGSESQATQLWSLPRHPHVSTFAGSLSQPVLTQPSSLSSYLGASARLTCTLSSGFNVGDFWICWYQQKPGNPPRYLLTFHSDSDKYQGSGVPSRFSGFNNASTNAGILLISGLQPEDETDDYCATYHGNSKVFTVLWTHGEVRQNPPHCSALLTKEAWKFLPPPPASGGPSELHRQNLSDIPQSWGRDPQVVATSGSEETLAHSSYPLDSPGSLPSSKKALIFESSPVKREIRTLSTSQGWGRIK